MKNEKVDKIYNEGKVKFILKNPMYTFFYICLGIYLGKIINEGNYFIEFLVIILSYITLVFLWVLINYFRWKKLEARYKELKK